MHEERYTAWRDTFVGDACVRFVKFLVVVVAVVAAVAMITRVSQGSTSRTAGIHSAETDRIYAYHDGQLRRSGPDGEP